ncbi:MAG: hypothetical protein AABW41_01430 [Nanoarchaeota archaeon]
MKKAIIVSLFLISLLFLSSCTKKASPQLDNFAKCLTDNGVKFYGAFWCPHCANQKKMFGDSFQYINSIECSTPDGRGQMQICKDAKIEGYPTWEFKDGSRLSGELTIEQLASKSGCSLPN